MKKIANIYGYNQKNVYETIYGILISLLPIMTIYGVSYITIADIIIVILMLKIVIQRKFQIGIVRIFLPFILYLFLQPIIINTCINEDVDIVDLFGSSCRLAFYLIAVNILVNNIFNYENIKKGLRVIAISSSIYAMLQFVLGTYLKISLSTYLPLLPILNTGLTEQQTGWINYGMIVRARAWFSEPSTLSIFLLLALYLEFFCNSDKNISKLCVVIYVMGILVSYSSTGFIGMVIIFVFDLFDLCRKGIRKKMLLYLVIVIATVSVVLLKTGVINAFIGHTFSNGKGLMSQSHFSSIKVVLQNKSSFLEIIVGHGLQNVYNNMYLPGWVRLYYCLGIVDVLLYSVIFIFLYKKSNSSARKLLVLFVILNIGSEIMLGIFCILYFIAILIINDTKRKV